MPVCSRNGCKKEYTEHENGDDACTYHSGGPVFHEGLKSWSCCSDVNKPELDFDVFMNIPGCQTGSHTTKVEVKEKTVEKPKTTDLHVKNEANGVEVYTQAVSQSVPTTATPAAPPPPPPPPAVPVEEEQDDLNTFVKKGTICKRKGCGKVFTSDEENRVGDGEGTRCIYHPSAPIFHEGSKGYMCCKRRVLEFDEFLKIEGCKVGRHLFAPKQKKQADTEQLTICRIDHYQTPMDVHVSVFAKQVDQDKSSVLFEEEMVHLDLYLPHSKRFKKTLNLYGPIDPKLSKYTVLSTKVEITLSKGDSRSWNLLEKSEHDVGQFKLTFGVGGRTGTVGSREATLDLTNQIKK